MKSIRRRRLEKRTDYKLRLGLLKSEIPRIVIRKTNRYVLAQVVSTDVAQDKVIFGESTKFLLSNGWPKEKSGSLKSLIACYLLGRKIGNEVKEKKISKLILDMGMNRNIHKSRIYAVLKGIIDSGVNVPHDASALPLTEDLKKNTELAKMLDKIK